MIINDKDAWENWYRSIRTVSERHLKVYQTFLYFLKQNNCKTVLELGCGDGKLMYMYDITIPRTKVVGIDITRKALLSAIDKNKESKKDFVHGNVDNMPFKNDSFDGVIIIDLLHHITGETRLLNIKNVIKCLKETIRVSKNNSCILIWDLSLRYKIYSYLIYWMTLVCSKLKIQIPSLQITDGIIVSFFTPKELNDILEKLQISSVFTETGKILFPYIRTYRYLFMGKIKKTRCE